MTGTKPETLVHIGDSFWQETLTREPGRFSAIISASYIGGGIEKIEAMDLQSLRNVQAIIIDSRTDFELDEKKEIALSQKLFPGGVNPGNALEWASSAAEHIRKIYAAKSLPCPKLMLGTSTRNQEKVKPFDMLLDYEAASVGATMGDYISKQLAYSQKSR